MNIVGMMAAKVIAEARPIASKFKNLLPRHHVHKNSGTRRAPASAFILKPHPFQETKNADIIQLLIRIQREYLGFVSRYLGEDPEFMKLISYLEDPDIDEETREMAESKVKEACMEYGELILHGDLLTVKMIQEAKLIMSGSSTAFGKLEFIGPCRIQLMHMKMKKVCQDYYLAWKNEINYDDILSLPFVTALTGMKVSK